MKDKALKLAGERTVLIDELNKSLERIVGTSQRQLLDLVVEEFVDQLDSKGGTITNSLKNKRLVALLDTVFKKYAEEKGVAVSKTIVDGVQKVVGFNKRYFSVFDKPATLLPIQKEVTTAISSWLGVDNGTAARNGYLDTLVKADPIKQELKDMAMAKVVGQAGLTDLRKAVRGMLGADTEGDLGRLGSYYRNFTYDLYSQVDRTAAKITADKLGLKYAIYEGGLIKTSRKFCKDRNGKVFTSEEIAEFDPPEAKQPDYNAATDLGGYGCRHHLNYIPFAVAVALRPDLKNDNPKPPVKPEPPKPEDPSPASKEVPVPKKIPPRTPFESIKEYEIQAFKPANEAQQRAMNSYAGNSSKVERMIKLEKDIWAERNKLSDKVYEARVLGEREQEEKHFAGMNILRDRYGKILEARQKIQKELDSFNDAFRRELLKGKQAESQVPINIKTPSLGKNKAFKEETGKATMFFRKAAAGWMEEFPTTIEIEGGAKRAYALETSIHVNPKTPARTIVHELGHILERGHNEIMKAAIDFLDRRTKGKPIVKFQKRFPGYGYRADEIFKDGGFLTEYVGKLYHGNSASKNVYNGIRATEVISMGLEYMYHDPLGFLRKDPEHFSLIYSLFFKK